VSVGDSIKCTGYNPKGQDAVYRIDQNGHIRWYPTPEIAASWDPNWKNKKTFDCTGFVLDDMKMKA
jgi:hypothetical protein